MKITAPLAGFIVATTLVACASNKADLYQAPPNDGSAAANSSDVVDNPAITPSSGSGKKTKGADVVDRPASQAAPAAKTEPECIDPITQEPVVGPGHVGYYGQWQIRFNSAADAAQFAALPRAKRNKLGTAQVLPQKGIHNAMCPLTGETLTAQAAPVTWDGKVIGFATVADANQFRALKKDKQSKIIAAWMEAGSK